MIQAHPGSGQERFPDLKGESLSGNVISVPGSFSGKTTLVLVAFRRGATAQVNSWLLPFAETFRDDPRVAFVEVPLLDAGWKFMSGWIDGGMRSGIPEAMHDHVVTVYGGADSFRKQMGIDDVHGAYAWLLDREGNIIWHGRGMADAASREKLFSLTREESR